MAEATDEANRSFAQQVIDRLGKEAIRPGGTAAVLGLAYKPHSHVVEESQGIYLAEALDRAGMRVVAYDPLARETARTVLPDQIKIVGSIAECLVQADLVLVTTPDPVFRRLTAEDFLTKESRPTVVDFWRILADALSGQSGIKYVPIGRGAEETPAATQLSALWNQREVVSAT